MPADLRAPSGSRRDQPDIAAAVQSIADKATLLVREEIELAKVEVTQKVTHLGQGLVVTVAAGIFVVFGLTVLLQGFAWLAYELLPTPTGDFFWGFFFVAFVLFLLGALAGFLATRLFKRGGAPTPTMAIQEAERIKQTINEARA